MGGGGGSASLSSAVRASSGITSTVNNPYTISNLWYNCKVNSFINIEDTRTVITNMYEFAHKYIPNCGSITHIPDEYSPNSINTALAQNWGRAFKYCDSLLEFPDPFYDTSNAINVYGMFGRTGPSEDPGGCFNIKTVPNFDTSNVTDMSAMFFHVTI